MNCGIYATRLLTWSILLFFITVLFGEAQSQEKIKIAYISTDTINQVWTFAQDVGFF
jgi:hypothetical protein